MKTISVYTTASEDNDLPHRPIYGILVDGAEIAVLEKEEAVHLFHSLDTCLGGKVIGEAVREAKSNAVDRIVEAITNAAKASKTGWIG